MPLKIVIHGALGRMGVEIANAVLADDAVKLHACVEFPGHKQIGQDYGLLIGKGTLGIPVSDSIDQIDLTNTVIIDFSSVQSTVSLLKRASKTRTRMVVGTTGLGDSELDLARKVAKEIPLLVSSNMSLGVNLLFSLTGQVAARLKDQFDIEIIEAHHRFKKDAPSGTAHRLGEIVADALGVDYNEAVRNGREGISDSIRSKNEIGMHAVRGGNIIGDHTVLFAGIGEQVELRHTAYNRNVFAVGAVTAAKWLADRSVGLYSIKDVLGL